MNYYPLALDISGWGCLVVGGGPVGLRRAQRFHAAGGRVTAVSPTFAEGFTELSGADLRQRPFEESDLDDIFIAQAATSDPELNAHIASLCSARGILVNIADDFENSDYLAPVLLERGELQVAITTQGNSPAFARWLKERLESWLPPDMEQFITFLGRARSRARAQVPDQGARRQLADYLATPSAYTHFSKLEAADRETWLDELITEYRGEAR